MAAGETRTREFTITAGNADMYYIEEYTDGAGNVRYQTREGQEVLKNQNGLYSIPALKVKAVDNHGVQ